MTAEATGELVTVPAIAGELGVSPHDETPAGLIRLAISKDLDIEKLERLIRLQRERDEDLARQEFCEALSNFQGAVSPIGREDRVDAGRAGRRKYASLGTIFAAIREPLRQHGLSFRFRQQQAGDQITITCIVSHALGHAEETSLTAAPDVSGGKNAIQAIGSTVTYLQRYTLVAALGLTTCDDDDDGETAGSAVVTEAEKARAQQAASVKAQLFGGAAPATVETPQQPPADPPQSLPESTPITPDQKARIRDLVEKLQAHASLEKALAKRNVASINSLTYKDAEDIAKGLFNVYCQRQADAAAGDSKIDQQAREAQNAGPCTRAQVDLAKGLIAELEQMQPGITKKIKAKLTEAGLAKVCDLTLGDCERFLQQLGRRNIEEFLAASLSKPTHP